MRVAVLGGKLQGVEACYLARKAGWEIVLVDKNPAAPAALLGDEFHRFDLLDGARLRALLARVDFAVPALEDREVLDHIEKCARQAGVKVVYDRPAYSLSSSKLASDQLFANLGVPAPRPWPACRFPVTVKPSGASGSEGVQRLGSAAELEELRARLGSLDGWVVQEFLEGPSYSIEVIGCGGACRTFQVTELAMDEEYDCKRVLAPAQLDQPKEKEFADLAAALARELQLEGIMDVEVILHDGQLKVLEIDARLPSQTLTAVYQSTGINVLELLWRGCGPEEEQHFTYLPARGVVYEHIRVSPGRLEVCGEHIMADAGPLQLQTDFFGADEALTNYAPGRDAWVATLIVTGASRREAWQRRCAVIQRLMDEYGIDEYRDASPA